MGRLERKLDLDLVSRIKARADGTLYVSRPDAAKPIKKIKPPRQGRSYRGARRNFDRIKGWPDATFAKSRPLARSINIPLNRSDKWPRAKSYAYAREIGPSSEPVR